MLRVADYGAGNLFSIANALNYLGIEFSFAETPEELEAGDGIVLPGVGAFPNAVEMLKRRGLFEPLRAPAKPVLGICLGMQLLFSESEEFGFCEGLGLLPGRVRRLPEGLPVPHMGWNSLHHRRPCPVTRGVAEGAWAYFVHSYFADCPEEYVSSDCGYGIRVPGVVARGEVFGCQFHPEKSGEAGLAMLRNFDLYCKGERK